MTNNDYIKTLRAKLWAMRGPSEGILLYAVRFVGEDWWEMTTDLREALRWAEYAQEVKEFWKLD